MAEQSLTFTVLPQRPVSPGRLALSVLLTPRLAGASRLAAFPDFLNWPQRLLDHGLRLTLEGGGTAATVSVPVSGLRPDIWARVFTAQTYVDAHTVTDLTQNLFVSYPARDALAYLKFAYQTVALGATSLQRRLAELLDPLTFRDGDASTLDSELAKLRVAMWQEQQTFLHPPPEQPQVSIHTRAASAPPDGVASTTTMPAGVHDTISRFALFHHMPPAPHRPPLPSTAADFEKLLDFHRALTALSSYPDVMRALGLVFDLEVPVAACAASPSGDSYRTVAITRVTPGAPWRLTPTLCLPTTSYALSATSFTAAPASTPTAVETGAVVAGDIVDGVLALHPLDFHLLQVDLDGALLKALTLADNAAHAGIEAVQDALPALRSSGIGLVASGRALQFLRAVADNVGFDAQRKSGTETVGPFSAVDLNRGYRLDVWSSRTGRWHSLHRRQATYRFGETGDAHLTIADEEGMLHPSVAQPAPDPTRPSDPVASAAGAPQPSGDIYLHERVANWAGWSLSATRPGGVLNRDLDPGKATDADPTLGQPLTPFKMTSTYAVVSGSLPLLRFGDRYRLRARAVDLAGNSIPLASDTSGAAVLPADDGRLIYLRFDPVSPPLVVLQSTPGPGASLERLVIRSHNSSPALDATASTEGDRRHLGPPRSAVRLVEQHGALDDTAGRLRGGAALYEMIVERDRAAVPVTDGVPLEPGALLDVSYLPDPIAAGAVLRDLPGAPGNTSADSTEASFAYRTLPDVQPRAGSVTRLDFGSVAWPGRTAVVLTIEEGAGPPRWDATQRTLTVSLPKATEAEVPLSSLLTEADLELMGVWGWIREIAEAGEAAAMVGTLADTEVPLISDVLALLTRLALEGGHELITPSRTLTLVHAVQQPIGEPAFVQLPVIHRPADPILASALRNEFTPITAWRVPGSHAVALLGGLAVHGASTVKLELDGSWREFTDDPTQPAPTDTLQRDHVETISLASTDGGVIYSDASETVAVGVYVPRVDTLWFSAPFDELEGIATPSALAAPQHHLPDTRHRWIGYRAVATSRFVEYFGDDSLDYTRTGPPLIVDVPSSARPAAPDIAYVVPTFGWERQESTNLKSSLRFGNGLRVYLNRPWWSSGADELLGVVLWPRSRTDPDDATREALKPYFTQWGADPIWKSGDLAAVPGVSSFPDASQSAQGLKLATGMIVDVAGHEVHYDAGRKIWYCDVQFTPTPAYAPFVRLALARYQPHSIPGVELSRVVLADFAQLAPTRSAVMTIDPNDPRRARVFVGGLAPAAPTQSIIEVTIEARRGDVRTDLGWQPAPAAAVTVTEDQPTPSSPDAVLWMGSVAFAAAPAPGAFRIVVREYEVLPVDGTSDARQFAKRLVYAAFLNYDYGVSA
ncbi:MAG TPA: hypothetical protein VGI07_04195 [Solirubrobacteraceae bacterium]